MGWRDTGANRSKGSRRPARRRAAPLGVETLENRTMLDASGTLASGLLSVTAGTGRETIDLSLNQASGNLELRDGGRVVGTFASADVDQILIDSTAGNHNVKIAQDVLQPASILGGPGKVLLQAGGGPTALVAGDGNTKLVGGPGANVFIGGAGNDTMISRSGQDTLEVGPGRNRLFVRGNDQVVGLGANDTVIGGPGLPDPGGTTSDSLGVLPTTDSVLTSDEVNTLLERAAAASPSNDGIIAVVDREGNILGVRVESGVSPDITGDPEKLTFAIDGAVSEARTGAFFANDQAPLTSRTVEFISQSTITQQEVESDPNIQDPNSPLRGPGLVAPVGVGGHFPPRVMNTPQVDLFEIELSNRDSIINPGPDLIKGTADDVVLPARFNDNPAYIPPGQNIPAPESYGLVSGLDPSAQSRGMGTLPGGVPIFKDGTVAGGMGVFFPGTTGFATEENSNLSNTYDPSKPDRSLEAETIAFAAVGGSPTASSADNPPGTFDFRGPIGNAPALPSNFGLPDGRIDLMGVTLDVFGPGGRRGPDILLAEAQAIKLGTGNANDGVNEPVTTTGATLLGGTAVPTGWLVTPHDSSTGGLTAADVTQIIEQGVAAAQNIRAQIRLPLGSHASYVFAVTDTNGEVLGMYRMPDATYFSIDVAVAKARNVSYYDDPSQLQPADQVPGVPPGTAFTNRTFRYLAEPFFPEGIDSAPPGPFSILNDGGSDPKTGLTVGQPLPASDFQSVLGYDAFNPDTNFHQPWNPNQNGVVFFPGSSPLYKNGQLVGGLGVSGDGVDEDDVATAAASQGFGTPANVLRADQVFVQGIRLPYQEFDRNPTQL